MDIIRMPKGCSLHKFTADSNVDLSGPSAGTGHSLRIAPSSFAPPTPSPVPRSLARFLAYVFWSLCVRAKNKRPPALGTGCTTYDSAFAFVLDVTAFGSS